MLSDADVVLLSLLAESPRHGYDLDRLIDARGYREWTSLAFSSVYYVLGRLAERGLIAPVPPDTGRRTVYALTGTGRQQLRAAADDRVRRPDRPSAGVLPALGAYESLDDPELQTRLAERATGLTERIEWLGSASRAAPHPTARAIFDFELARHRAELDWVRHLIDRSAATTDETPRRRP